MREIAVDQRVDPSSDFVPLLPGFDRGRVEADEDPLAELLDRRQPVGPFGDRRAAHGKQDLLEIALGRAGRRLEAGEAVEAHHLAEPVHGDDRADHAEIATAVRLPGAAWQGARVEPRVAGVDADLGLTAGEEIELQDARIGRLAPRRPAS